LSFEKENKMAFQIYCPVCKKVTTADTFVGGDHEEGFSFEIQCSECGFTVYENIIDD
jgi:hypothetical protein